MIEAVLFDLGGTLHLCHTTPERARWFALRVIDRLADYGIVISDTPAHFAERLAINAERYKQDVENSLRELPVEVVWNDYYLKDYDIGRARIQPVAEELSFLYDYERVSNMRRPRLIETMTALKGMGLRLGIISNIISTTLVPHFVLEYGLEPFMSCVVTSAGCGIRKPSADIFRIAEASLDLRPEQLAYVGDTISRDVRGVRNAGWRLMIQIPNPGSARRDACMKGLGYAPDERIEDLSEIPEIIKRYNQTD